jgi:hypothetical protein
VSLIYPTGSVDLNAAAESLIQYIKMIFMLLSVTTVVDYVTKTIKVTLGRDRGRGHNRTPPTFDPSSEESIQDFEIRYHTPIVIVDCQAKRTESTLTIRSGEDSVNDVSSSKFTQSNEYIIDSLILLKN